MLSFHRNRHEKPKKLLLLILAVRVIYENNLLLCIKVGNTQTSAPCNFIAVFLYLNHYFIWGQRGTEQDTEICINCNS